MSPKPSLVYVAFLVVSLVLALPFFAFAGWCVYDGLVTYPERQQRYEAYQRLQTTHPDTYAQEWPIVAARSGWSAGVPTREIRETDILTQYIMSGVCSALGLTCLIVAAVFGWLMRRANRNVDSPQFQVGPT